MFPPQNNRTTYIIAIVAVVLIALGIYLLTHNRAGENFVANKDPQLSQEQLSSFQGRIAEAEAELDKVDKSDKDKRYSLLTKIASEYYPIGEYAKAKDYYEQALDIKSDQAETYYALANVERAMTDYKSSEKHINKALELNSKSIDLWRFKIELYDQFMGKEADQVEQVFTEAFDATDRSVDIITFYARYNEILGNRAKAIELWKEASEKNPGDKETYDREIENLQNTQN